MNHARPFLKIWSLWCDFFFGPQGHMKAAVFRFLVALNFFISYSIRQVHWRFYFTDEGFLSSSQAVNVLPKFFQPFVAWLPTTASGALWMHSLLLISLFCLMIGFWGRLMAGLTLFLHLAFLQRNFSIVYGADIVASFLFFSLIFMDNSRCLSLEQWLGLRRDPTSDRWSAINAIFHSVGVRMIQIQLCVIYAYTGLEKMKGAAWWDGTAVWSVFGNQQIMLFDFTWIVRFPLLIGLMTFSVLLFEVYFPVLVWLQSTRRFVLAYGFMLHLMIGVTVGLVFFSGAMVSAYVLFIDEPWLVARFTRRRVA